MYNISDTQIYVPTIPSKKFTPSMRIEDNKDNKFTLITTITQISQDNSIDTNFNSSLEINL